MVLMLDMKYNTLTEICGKDHSYDLFNNWYCTAMPIRDNYNGKTMGYLDISRIGIPNISEQSTILKNIVVYLEECISQKSEISSEIGTKIDDTDILILSSLARNYLRKIVIKDIDISERTLRRHINKLYNLMSVSNDVGLVMTAFNAGIIDSHGEILL